MAENKPRHMTWITSLSATAGLITALFAVNALWEKHGWATKGELNTLNRNLSVHILESRLMIMRLEAAVGPVDEKHKERMERLQGILDKLHRQEIKEFYVLE